MPRENGIDKWQAETMRHFITRPKMYLYNTEKATVVAFVDGLEIGSKQTFKLSEKISELVEKKYRIKKRALGWPYQVQKYADKNSLEWFDGFKKLIEELFVDS